MKIAIVGSRRITNADLSAYVNDDADMIISGGANGIDRLAAEFAKAKGISFLEILPEYEKYGRCAPLVRNRKIVDVADFVIIIWDGKSRGSKFVIDYCKKVGKPYRIERENTDFV